MKKVDINNYDKSTSIYVKHSPLYKALISETSVIKLLLLLSKILKKSWNEIVIRKDNYYNLMKKTLIETITTRSFIILSIMIIIASGLTLFSFNLNIVMGIPADIVKGDYLFGRTIGITEDENGKPLWIISGNWKTNLSNQTQAGDNSTILDASFKMIKTDGTSKDTHTLTDFVLTDTATSQNNVTVFNGTGIISMPEGPITDVPISIKVMNNEIGIIYIDPNKVDNHFGTKPLYGIPLEESEQYQKKS